MLKNYSLSIYIKFRSMQNFQDQNQECNTFNFPKLSKDANCENKRKRRKGAS